MSPVAYLRTQTSRLEIMAVGHNIPSSVATAISAMWMVMLVSNFTFTFNQEYTAEKTRQRQDAWLLARCEDPEFVMNMKQHADLCRIVEAEAQMNVPLSALHSTMAKLHMCGMHSCDDLLRATYNSIGMHSHTAFASVIVLAMLLPTIIMPMYRRWAELAALHHIRSKMERPYDENSDTFRSLMYTPQAMLGVQVQGAPLTRRLAIESRPPAHYS
jgi:hypothetical protein